MKKDIRDMIRSKLLTGDKVGQTMIRDFVMTFQRQSSPQDISTQPLTENEKAQLVAALDSSEEVLVYSQYKFVTNYLQQVSLHHTCAWQEVEINFLRLYSALSPQDDVEQLLGVIHGFSALAEQGAYDPLDIEGIGVSALLDRLGAQLSAVYRNFLASCRQTLAVEEALSLLGERIEVEELKTFIYPAGVGERLNQCRALFDRLSQLPPYLTPAQADALDARVQKLFPKVELSALYPTERAKAAARKALVQLSLLERPGVLHTMLVQEGDVHDAP